MSLSPKCDLRPGDQRLKGWCASVGGSNNSRGWSPSGSLVLRMIWGMIIENRLMELTQKLSNSLLGLEGSGEKKFKVERDKEDQNNENLRLVSQSYRLCVFIDCSHRAPLSMEFSGQEYWSGLPFSSPKDLPDPGIKHPSLGSPALAGGFFTTSAMWKAPVRVCQPTILQFLHTP